MVGKGEHSPWEDAWESQQREENSTPYGLSLPNAKQDLQNKGKEAKNQAKKSFEEKKRAR